MLQAKFEKLSVFFPMWNEEQYLQRALNAAQELCVELQNTEVISDYELIIVNDASTDSTAQLANAAAARDSHVKWCITRLIANWADQLSLGLLPQREM